MIKPLKKLYSCLNPIALGSSLFVATALFFSIVFPDIFFKTLSWIQNTFVFSISWFYIVVIFFLFWVCVYLSLSHYGKLRLGGISKPRYNTFTWIAMLFSAGMGTGLVFSGVYEPLFHYLNPPIEVGNPIEAMNQSFQITFLHWGFSGWVVYVYVGLIISYFCFQKKLPFRVSSMLYPLLKEKIYGKIGIFIDIISVVAILLGVGTTLGRGALQINSGLKHLFEIPFSGISQALIIIVITLFATVSVLSGIHRGIRRLSELNIILCLLLLFFMIVMGPTVFILNSFVEQTGAYLQNLITQMTRINSLGSSEWRSQWTILYWAWWISWSPFVGLFIAKVSEGRTIREFIIGCLFLPALISCLWFTAFGGTVIHYHIDGLMNLEPFLETEYSILTFKFLESFPLPQITSFLTVLTLAIFFITSSDSASYVIHHMTSYKKTPSQSGKIYWSFMEGLLALVLILLGGIQSLELLVIASAFPFTVLICFMVYGYFKELRSQF